VAPVPPAGGIGSRSHVQKVKSGSGKVPNGHTGVLPVGGGGVV
jgi:hypothetical protein